jgi:serine/threonine-protein kinase RsbW
MQAGAPNRLLELEIPSDPVVVSSVRAAFEEYASTLPLTHEEVESIKIALSEACSNAICHGSPKGVRNRVLVRCQVDAEELVIQVRDEGAGFSPAQVPHPSNEDEFKPSGRGIFLMRALMDEVRIDSEPRGTCVTMVKALSQPDAATHVATSTAHALAAPEPA